MLASLLRKSGSRHASRSKVRPRKIGIRTREAKPPEAHGAGRLRAPRVQTRIGFLSVTAFQLQTEMLSLSVT